MARRGARKARPGPAPVGPKEVDLGWLGGTVGYHLRIAQETAFQAFARRASDADARPWRFALLALIDSNPGVTQGDLAAAIRRQISTLTPALNELVRIGYVNRNRVETDRRSYALTLTPRGRKAMRQLMSSAAEHEREVDRLVGAGNRAAFLRILKRLADGLSQDRPAKRPVPSTKGKRKRIS
jgi:DNA-binding MarR family transcriptional regulator